MRLRLLSLLLISLFALSIVFAQEAPIPIPVGTIAGAIDDANPLDRYSFQMQAGQEAVIRMVRISGALDPRLFLFDSLDTLITSDDDSAGDRNAEITYRAETTGTYIIEASRFGIGIGDYELSLSITDTDTDADSPFNIPPNFAVNFTPLAYDEAGTGNLDSTRTRLYYVIGSQQGDFVRIELNTTNGDLNANITLYRQDLQVVSRLSQSTPEQKVIFAAIPQTGWYLIEVTQQTGSGIFSVTPTLVSDTLLSDTTPTEAFFDESTDTLFFILNATINERIFVNLTVKDGRNIVPELQIEDINRNLLVEPRSSQGAQTRVSLTAPRSGPYIVQARNLGAGDSGSIELQLRRSPADISKLNIRETTYNENEQGFITAGNPIDYYRFGGKAGELVTIRMSAVGTNTTLDPYIILADSAFNELIFNDNVTTSRNAQIAQYRLPSDGDYYVLASRVGLANGTTSGTYEMSITVGELRLATGQVTATLTWEGQADLNLFVRTPDGYTVSWANPNEPSGGQLQIDSNTGCETPTDQPIEHIYFETLDLENDNGDYVFWVWHQNNCGSPEAVPYTLVVSVDGRELVNTNSQSTRRVLQSGSRFESSIRIGTDGSAVVVNEGTESNPSPQQVASQGGDRLIRLGDTIDGSINDVVFAQFYQFEGTEGETIRITVERVTGNLDPIVVLRSAADRNIASNDDISPDNHNSQLEYTLESTGRYVIAVTRYGLRDGATLGDYRLTLERVEN